MSGGNFVTSALAKVLHAASSDLRRNTLWMMVSQGGRLVIQALYFSLLARALGTAGYGAFVSVMAVAALVTPLATFGAGQVLLQRVATEPEAFGDEWGRALSLTLVTASALALAAFALGRITLPPTVPTALLASVVLADVVFASLLGVVGQCYQALGQLRRTAVLQLTWSLLKLLAAGALRFTGTSRSPAVWGVFYLLATGLSGVGAALLVSVELGRPRVDWRRWRGRLRDGGYFAFGEAAKTVYDDIDKAMLARLATLEAAGLYGAAYRIVELSLTPVRALLAATYPDFFRAGADGMRGSLRYGRPFIFASVGYGVLASVGLAVSAPMVPWLLGEQYRASVEAVRWLALLPLLKSAHYVVADTLTGAGLQARRTVVQLAIAVLNVVCCVVLIPAYGWRGAAAASVATDAALLVALVLVAWASARSERLSTGRGAIVGEPSRRLAPGGAAHIPNTAT